MSLIERALERLKREAARKEVGPPAQAAMSRVGGADPETRDVAGGQTDIRATTPCRADRTVTVDLSELRAFGSLAPPSEERRLAEEYRILKRPLLKQMSENDAGGLRNMISVTSALPGEGKTFTSVNLALSLAMERGREVVLVDGDVAKRDVTRMFGLDGEPGLLDAGADEEFGLEQTVLRTDLSSLFLLPAGRPHAEATEILRSERTNALLTTLASSPHRIVLIDSAPMLVTSEAGVLASLAGQVILIVKASETPQEVVLRAIEAVAEDARVSLILNKVLSAPERHYGYYYGGYGYGRPAYGSERDTSAGKKDHPA